MKDKYLLSTWTVPCPCGRVHRVILIADNGHAEEDGYAFWADNLSRGVRCSPLTQTTIDRDLVDGFFSSEYQA